MKYAQLTKQAIARGRATGWNPVMQELARRIKLGLEENKFTYRADNSPESTQLFHPFFDNKDSDGRESQRAHNVGWWYKPGQWERYNNQLEGAEEI